MGCSFNMECAAVAENRKEQRYCVFMKAIAKEISQFPGCVEEVSKSGCKINFPYVEDFDFESEYSATVYSPSSAADGTFDLILKPNWCSRGEAGAVIGFSVLCTPGYRSFLRFVERTAAVEEG